MTRDQKKRAVWIGGLAALGAAVVGGIAYAVAKSSGTTNPSGTPPPFQTVPPATVAPSPSPYPTFRGPLPSVYPTFVPPTPSTSPAPPQQQTVTVVEGTSNYSAQAVANGLLTINFPSGTKVTAADPGGTGTVLTLNPTSVQVALNGSGGNITANYEDLNTIAQYSITIAM